MKNTKLRVLLSFLGLFTLLFSTTTANAETIRFNQVKQIVNARPGKAQTGSFTLLRLSEDTFIAKTADTKTKTLQDDRVIVTKTTEIVEEDACACDQLTTKGFPNWALLGFGAIPVGLILANRGNEPSTPPTNPPLPPDPPAPPKPEPVPEPMTILLFGTGLTGISMVARRRFHCKSNKDNLLE